MSVAMTTPSSNGLIAQNCVSTYGRSNANLEGWNPHVECVVGMGRFLQIHDVRNCLLVDRQKFALPGWKIDDDGEVMRHITAQISIDADSGVDADLKRGQ